MAAPPRSLADIFRGSLAYLLAGVLNSLAPFLVSVLIARYLGKEDLGLFSICFALVLGGILVSDLGLNPLVLREFAGTRSPEALNLRTLLLIRWVVAWAAGLLALLVSQIFLPGPNALTVGIMACLFIVVRSIAGTLENVIKARMYRMTSVAITMAGSAAHVLLVFAALEAGSDLSRVLLIMTGVETLKILFLSGMVRAELRSPLQGFPQTVQSFTRLVREGLPFALIGVFTLVNERSALFFLSSLCGNAEAGVYSAADRFMSVATLIDSSLLASAFPVLTLFRDDPRFHRITRQGAGISLSLGILGALVLAAGAPLLMRFSFRYAESAGLLRILALAFPAALWNSTLRVVLFSMHRERRVAAAFGVLCMLNLVLSVAIIPRYASAGAALVSVFAEYGMAVAYGVIYLRSIQGAAHPLRQEVGGAAG